MGNIISFKNSEDSIELLKQHLSEAEVGYPADPGQIVELLADAWDQFDKFDDTKMAGYKLFRRMENVTWKPPCLTFQIERHGATVLGSTRADLYTWSVDLDRRTAEIIGKNRRQLYPTVKPVRVKPIAEDVGKKICNGENDPRLTWIETGEKVRVILKSCFPQDDACKMTMQNRARNLRKALNSYLNPLGWQQEKPTGSPVFFNEYGAGTARIQTKGRYGSAVLNMHFHNAGFLASLPNTPNRKAKNNARNQSLHDELQDAGVQKVIDIRLNTASQFADFAKKNDLAYFLKKICHCNYRHEPLLAPTKEILDDFKRKRISWPEYEKQFNELKNINWISDATP